MRTTCVRLSRLRLRRLTAASPFDNERELALPGDDGFSGNVRQHVPMDLFERLCQLATDREPSCSEDLVGNGQQQFETVRRLEQDERIGRIGKRLEFFSDVARFTPKKAEEGKALGKEAAEH